MSNKYSISVISNSCGIKAHTIRIWEKRYNVFKPERNSSGKRLYSENDLKKAKLIAQLLDRGHSISELALSTIEELENLLSKLESQDADHKVSNAITTRKLLKHLEDYEIEKVADELQHLRLSVGVKEFIFDMVLPTMREVGRLVYKGKYSVTQEHIISTIIRDQLSQIYLPNLGTKDKEVALATPDGNLHELSIIFADLLCRANRVATRYLGASHPSSCLAEALNALKTPYLVLGAVSSDQWDYKKNIVKYLNEIDNNLDYEITVVLGGGLTQKFPEFKRIKELKVMSSFEEFDSWLRS